MSAIRKIRGQIETILGHVLVGIFAATVLMVTWQVIGRHLLSAPSSATEKIARFLLIWLACILFALMVMVGGGGLLVNVMAALRQTSPALGIPIWTVYTVMPISGLIITFFAVTFLIEGAPSEAAPVVADLETIDD